MKREIKEIREKFVSMNAALMAFQAAQMHFIMAGFLTTSYVSPQNKRIELTIHFDLSNYPTIPIGYTFSRREIDSHPYYSSAAKETIYVRTEKLDFEY